jgi:hypothetical protein
MQFQVTARGVHAQIALLEHAITASTVLSRARKAPLLADLLRTDRFFAAGEASRSRAQLASFIREALQLPELRPAPSGGWRPLGESKPSRGSDARARSRPGRPPASR